MRRHRSWLLAVVLASAPASLALVSCGSFSPSVGAEQQPTAQPTASASGVVFSRDIRPLMNRESTDPSGHGCKACHYPGTQSSHIGYDFTGLDLGTLGTLRNGGKNTGKNIVIAGNPDGSAIVQKLRGSFAKGSRMPQNGPPYWSDAEIQLMADWIAQGALGADDE